MALVLTLENVSSLKAIRKLQAQAPIAEARALNRSATSARAAVTRVIATDMGLKANVVRNRITIRQATPAHRSVTLHAPNKRIPLVEFQARGVLPSRGRGRGVTANVGGRKVYPHTFLAVVGGRHTGVFTRVAGGGSRRGPKPNRAQLPIKELFGPSIAHVFVKHKQYALDRAREELTKNLRHEFRFLLSQAAA